MSAQRLDHPVPGVFEARSRLEHLKHINAEIQKSRPGFRLYFEYLVAILMVDKQKIETGGRLSLTNGVTPFVVQGRLEFISPFCKHYMFHLRSDKPDGLDPQQVDPLPKDKNWYRGQARLPPNPKNPVNHALFNKDLDTIKATMYYDKCFKTKQDLDPVYRDMEQEEMCEKRDEGKCVLTGESKPRVFYFIPITWNDTVEHNNATGILKQGSVELAGINLLRAPGNICSVKELGNSHKAWNMLCVQSDLYKHLSRGDCAFKFAGYTKLDQYQVLVTLEFCWMPRMPKHFNKDIAKDSGQTELEANRIKAFHFCLVPRRLPTNRQVENGYEN